MKLVILVILTISIVGIMSEPEEGESLSNSNGTNFKTICFSEDEIIPEIPKINPDLAQIDEGAAGLPDLMKLMETFANFQPQIQALTKLLGDLTNEDTPDSEKQLKFFETLADSKIIDKDITDKLIEKIRTEEL